MIKFIKETTLPVLPATIADDDFAIPKESNVTFKANEVVDAHIYYTEKDGKYVDIQFSDGSIAISVLRKDFIVIY